MSEVPKRVVGLVVLLVLLAWAGFGWYLMRLRGALLSSAQREDMQPSVGAEPSDALSSLGLLGDAFGALNTLFSGLALAAIALTIYLDYRSRREGRKPLVVVSPDESAGGLIDRPIGQKEAPSVWLHFPVNLANQSDDAALNISIGLRLGGRQSFASCERSLSFPLIRGSNPLGEDLKIELKGDSLDSAVFQLTSTAPLSAIFFVRYTSLEGVQWETSVAADLRCHSAFSGHLNATRNATWSAEGVWEEKLRIPISISISAGSWTHKRC